MNGSARKNVPLEDTKTWTFAGSSALTRFEPRIDVEAL
jgi:hypothetical protein